jgi:hypothetical protein
LSDEKKLGIVESSQTLPDQFIEQTTLCPPSTA